MSAAGRRFADWFFWSEGSTRTLALIRVGFVFLAWDRFGPDFLFFRADDAVEATIGASFFLSTTLLLLGRWTGIAAAWTALTLLLVVFLLGHGHDVEPYRHHHVWLLACTAVGLALSPCGHSLSLDRWRALQEAEAAGRPPPPERGPLLGQRLLAMQVSAIYAWATFDKLHPGFLSGARLHHILLDRYGTSDPVTLPGFALACAFGAWATVAVEAALAVGLWSARARPALMGVGALFHGMLYVVLPVGPFSANMVLLYLAFVDPGRVHRTLARLLGDR